MDAAYLERHVPYMPAASLPGHAAEVGTPCGQREGTARRRIEPTLAEPAGLLRSVEGDEIAMDDFTEWLFDEMVF